MKAKLAVASALTMLLSACVFGSDEPTTYEQALENARAENLSHHASTDFEQTPQVIGDPYGDGVAASQRFFKDSNTLIISDDEIHSQLRAASLAVVSHSPMVTMRENNRSTVLNEVDRLQARYVLLVGDVSIATTRGEVMVIQDPGTEEALGHLTALKFNPVPVNNRRDVTSAIAGLEADAAMLLVPDWPNVGAAPEIAKASEDDVPHGFPGQSKRDADQTPLVIASPESSIAAAATARAYGAALEVLPYPDPRFDAQTALSVAGLAEEPLIALGSQFGDAETLSRRIEEAEHIRHWLPNGRGIVFSREPIYIEPGGVDEYEVDANTEAAAAIAVGEGQASTPSSSGKWMRASTLVGQDSFRANQQRVLEWAERLEAAGEFGVLLFEPGDELLVQQVNTFSQALSLPNIHVAVDASKVGKEPLESEELNAVAKLLATIVKEEQLAQKALIVIAEDQEQIGHPKDLNFRFPQVAFTLAADVRGAGTLAQAQQRYEAFNIQAPWHAAILRDGSFIGEEDGQHSDWLLESEQLKPIPWLALMGY
ncbi:hypothetical protein [Corynebacterium pelargi]|uniref:Uncharacterized protein n=1 Tax=Corynebacterium pelargi TaxID=1471400 RepID=A0A410W9B2_9CORY|nr:hypothetical protein [Corynebacterium pelargi]QAU52529.1 hypothetical protein CPELA_06330 [Corynebacterium pelargi]GGG77059.1 hypothetical protein GCM10007338_13570 [Corynebacterium pelargi]